MSRWHTCNVLKSGKEARRVWQFAVAANKFSLAKEESKLANEVLTAKTFAKDWDNLLRPKLNVACLPAEEVFIRVAQLPKADEAETRSMLELQLEKLSPLPVAQIVWSYEVIANPSAEMQTVVVILVGRHHVERFLGEIEKLQFFADRLELTVLDQLKAEYVQQDGLWLYPGWGTKFNASLIAWWQGGVLRNLSLAHLPEDETRAAVFQGQLKQMIWTGQLEGWLEGEPTYHVVAETVEVEAWRALFGEGSEVVGVAPIPETELATLTARRVASDSLKTNLLPPEYGTRYKQRFNDRLWMRGLMAVAAVYLIGVVVYLGLVEVANWKHDTLNDEVMSLANSYTNSLQLKEKVRILQGQLDLQYAALDCWKAASDNLPSELTLTTINFDRGQKVTFFGVAPSDGGPLVNDFNEALRNALVSERKLFKSVDGARITENPSTRQNSWSFACTLNRADMN